VEKVVEMERRQLSWQRGIQVPPVLADKLPAMSHLANQSSQDLLTSTDLRQLRMLARQATILSRRYAAVVANPPYMGGKYQTQEVKDFGSAEFPDAKSDVFACFIERAMVHAKPSGRIGVVSPYAWMFISSYQRFREKPISRAFLSTLIQLEYNAFEPAMVPVATFTLINTCIRAPRKIARPLDSDRIELY
jgi:type I restriction-modification system DNA methylase subunit